MFSSGLLKYHALEWGRKMRRNSKEGPESKQARFFIFTPARTQFSPTVNTNYFTNTFANRWIQRSTECITLPPQSMSVYLHTRVSESACLTGRLTPVSLEQLSGNANLKYMSTALIVTQFRQFPRQTSGFAVEPSWIETTRMSLWSESLLYNKILTSLAQTYLDSHE